MCRVIASNAFCVLSDALVAVHRPVAADDSREPFAGSSARSDTAEVGETSRPSVKASIQVRSSMPSRRASSSSACRWSMCEWTPPCETSPSRCTSPPRSRARSKAPISAGFSKSEPSRIATFTRWRSWKRIRPGADRQVTDLGIAHLALPAARPPHPRPSASCAGTRARAGRRPASPRARPRCQARAERSPSRRGRRALRGRRCPANRCEGVGIERGAADESAVDRRLRHELGGVLGLDRAAVEHRAGRAAP